MSLADKLIQMKEEIEQLKTTKAQSEGKLQSLQQQLKEFSCKNVDEAVALLDQWENDIQTREEVIRQGLEELEQSYDW